MNKKCVYVWVVCCCFIFAASLQEHLVAVYAATLMPPALHKIPSGGVPAEVENHLDARSSFKVTTNVKVSSEFGFIRRILNLTGVWRERNQAQSCEIQPVFSVQQVVLRLDDHLLPFLLNLFRRWCLIEVQTSQKKKVFPCFFLVFISQKFN